MADSVLQLCGLTGARRGGRRHGMMHATAMPAARCALRRACAAGLGFGLCGFAPADASHRCMDATPSQAAPSSDGAPALETVAEAYLAARSWLDADLLPRPDAPEAVVDLPRTEAVCVVLRLDGRVVGVGEDADPSPGMLRRAVGRAVSEALGDRVIRAVRADAADRVTARLSLEIELAGPTAPLLGRTIADAAARVVPGVDGLAVVRAGEVTRAFPSRLLAADIAARPDRTIARLLLDAGLPAKDLPAFTAADRVSLARFASVRLRGDAPDAPPTIVERGGRTVSIGEIRPSTAPLVATLLASRLAANALPIDRAAPESGAFLLGPYNPTAGVHDPPAASALDAALAALALADASSTTALGGAIRDAARDAARALRKGADSDLAAPGDRADAMAAMLALSARFRGDGVDEALVERLEAAARTATRRDADAAAPTSPATRALVAAGAVATGREDLAVLAGDILDHLLAPDRPTADLVDAALPLALLLRLESIDGGPPRPVAPAIRTRLVEVLEACATAAIELQVRGDDPERRDDLPADLLGGIPLPNARAALADSQCLQFAAAVAIASPALPDDGRAARHTAARWFLRFLLQHVADDPWVGGFRDPAALRGLVRASLAGDDCPSAATAVGLLLASAITRDASPEAPPAASTPAAGSTVPDASP